MSLFGWFQSRKKEPNVANIDALTALLLQEGYFYEFERFAANRIAIFLSSRGVRAKRFLEDGGANQ